MEGVLGRLLSITYLFSFSVPVASFDKSIGFGHHLSLFTIVRFPNSECIGTLGSNGTCYTATECGGHGGEAQGSCAQGFGVCCVFDLRCGGTTSQNVTYLNLNKTAFGNCNFEICSDNQDICKLRLDFESLSLTGPLKDTFENAVDSVVKNSHSIVGQCLGDSFIVASAEGSSPPIICGENSGQHMYTSLVRGCAFISVYIGTAEFQRSVKIKSTQVSCGSGPPDGCLQWLTGVQGTLQSFNNGGADTHLAGQEYTACVRREKGFCSICWSAAIFQMSLQTADAGQTGARGMSEHDKDCGRAFIPDDTVQPLYAGFQDYIEIPQGRCQNQGSDTDSIDRYCGEILACAPSAIGLETATPSTVCSSVLPFKVRVFTDEFEAAAMEDGVPDDASSPPQMGFKMFFQQMRCI